MTLAQRDHLATSYERKSESKSSTDAVAACYAVDDGDTNCGKRLVDLLIVSLRAWKRFRLRRNSSLLQPSLIGTTEAKRRKVLSINSRLRYQMQCKAPDGKQFMTASSSLLVLRGRSQRVKHSLTLRFLLAHALKPRMLNGPGCGRERLGVQSSVSGELLPVKPDDRTEPFIWEESLESRLKRTTC